MVTLSKPYNFQTDLVLYHGGRLRSTNFFVSVRLMLLLSRLTHYAAIKDNTSVKVPPTRVKTRIYQP